MQAPVSDDRLKQNIEENAEFGRIVSEEGRGRTVHTGTVANQQARDYFVSQLDDVGLDVKIDAVGNIVGRWEPATADPTAAPVAVGSHLDSVTEGGIFDGPLGVYAGLEAVRAMQDGDVALDRPIEVVSFTEEEGGQFSDGVLGSSVAAGARTKTDALALTNDDGDTLESVLSEIGYYGSDDIDPREWDSFLELHIEQSTELERAGVSAGVVTAVTGITHCEVEIVGEANHAGSTPMGTRTDALAAASEFVLAIESAANELVADESETAVGTVGNLTVGPGATNVVPGHVELGIDIRDVDYDSMNELVNRASRCLSRLERERGVSTSLSRPFDLSPTPMGDRCREALHAAGKATGVETMDLYSGAFHDTVHVADVTDAGMLFAPSRDGVSHNPREWTDWESCARATTVLTGALVQLATKP